MQRQKKSKKYSLHTKIAGSTSSIKSTLLSWTGSITGRLTSMFGSKSSIGGTTSGHSDNTLVVSSSLTSSELTEWEYEKSESATPATTHATERVHLVSALSEGQLLDKLVADMIKTTTAVRAVSTICNSRSGGEYTKSKSKRDVDESCMLKYNDEIGDEPIYTKSYDVYRRCGATTRVETFAPQTNDIADGAQLYACYDSD